jgi:hypothetical protein
LFQWCETHAPFLIRRFGAIDRWNEDWNLLLCHPDAWLAAAGICYVFALWIRQRPMTDGGLTDDERSWLQADWPTYAVPPATPLRDGAAIELELATFRDRIERVLNDGCYLPPKPAGSDPRLDYGKTSITFILLWPHMDPTFYWDVWIGLRAEYREDVERAAVKHG